MITIADLELINAKINLLPYKSDAERYFTPEWWTEITEEGGDCEDYAIAKYRKCIAAGVLKNDLRFATCFVEERAAHYKKDRYHCVLLVDLDGQTYVLDNRYSHPMEYQLLNYEWHKLQIAGTQKWEWAEGADRSFG